MTNGPFDVLCIGNAIVDVLSRTEEEFLVAENLDKGAMMLVDTDRSEYLYSKMQNRIESSGGSAGNTAAGLASLGASTAYFGKVADDALGATFQNDMRTLGVHYQTSMLVGGAPTARCMIMITPDGERTMNTYLGATQELTVDDMDPEIIKAAEITYMEGYLWDPANAKQAFRRAAEISHAAGKQTAITLSDSFCVGRFRDEFLELLKSGTIDIVFANDAELKSLYQTDDLNVAVEAVRSDAKLAAVTMGEDGSMAISKDETHHSRAYPTSSLEDTTGAGDLYASGFLYGLAKNMPLKSCADLGGVTAAEIIQHIGPRPAQDLKKLAIKAGLIS